jgi:hypothetical protein
MPDISYKSSSIGKDQKGDLNKKFKKQSDRKLTSDFELPINLDEV